MLSTSHTGNPGDGDQNLATFWILKPLHYRRDTELARLQYGVRGTVPRGALRALEVGAF